MIDYGDTAGNEQDDNKVDNGIINDVFGSDGLDSDVGEANNPYLGMEAEEGSDEGTKKKGKKKKKNENDGW